MNKNLKLSYHVNKIFKIVHEITKNEQKFDSWRKIIITIHNLKY